MISSIRLFIYIIIVIPFCRRQAESCDPTYITLTIQFRKSHQLGTQFLYVITTLFACRVHKINVSNEIVHKASNFDNNKQFYRFVTFYFLFIVVVAAFFSVVVVVYTN